MKKLKLLLFIVLVNVFVGIAQPPPPHPGGSGNQGAAIPMIGMLLVGASALVLGIKKKQ